MLFDPIQLSFFDTDLFKKDKRKASGSKRKKTKAARGRSKRLKP
jgi:hypothetical protein